MSSQNTSQRTKRAVDAMRKVVLTPDASRYAEGACLAQFGHTRVLCTASVEDRVPLFLRGQNKGWVTAEYGMLPRATHTRSDRKRNAESGRTKEISRLIGRSLRAITVLESLSPYQITIDCDVLEADGGTRTAAITGGYVALALACQHLVKIGAISSSPLTQSVAAISCGIINGQVRLDLDYDEDSEAEVDANFVITGAGDLVEVQATAEKGTFSRTQLNEMTDFAVPACAALTKAQQDILS